MYDSFTVCGLYDKYRYISLKLDEQFTKCIQKLIPDTQTPVFFRYYSVMKQFWAFETKKGLF